MRHSLWKMVWQFFKKFKSHSYSSPAVPLLSVYFRKIIMCSHEDLCTEARSSIVRDGQQGQAAQCSSAEEWADKWSVHAGECYPAVESSEALTHAATCTTLVRLAG